MALFGQVIEVSETLDDSICEKKSMYNRLEILRNMMVLLNKKVGEGVIDGMSMPVLQVSLPRPCEPNHYNGARDEVAVEEFIWKMTRYLGFCTHLSDENKVEMMVGCLKGDALIWWR